jgi:CDI immunity protein
MGPLYKGWVFTHTNHDFIFIETQSGYTSSAYDPAGYEIYLKRDATALEIGETILKALSKSRVVDPSEFGTFFDYKRIEQVYKDWILKTQSMYGYKTKKAMFRYMDCCTIRLYDDKMRIYPSHHEKMEAWGSPKNGRDDDVIIPYPSSAEEIGNAFLLALSRCTSSVG